MFDNSASVSAFLTREIEPGTSRDRVEAWIAAGTARGTFTVHALPGQAPQHLVFASDKTVAVPGDSSVVRCPRFMANLLFEGDSYAAHLVLDVSQRIPADDRRPYFGSDVEVQAFMRERFVLGTTFENALRRARELVQTLPNLTIDQSDTHMELAWTGASVERGFMTADGVRNGYQPLRCSTLLRFDAADRLMTIEHSAVLVP